MKVHVVYDTKGEVVAMGVPLPPAYDGSQPKSGPMALDEQHVAELQVPPELTHLSLVELSERIRVDTTEKAHRLVAK
jgi:hypothetical protein